MSKNKKFRQGIVYSTNPDYNYDNSGEDEAETLPPNQQNLYLRREIRNGKPAIVIKEFVGKTEDLKVLEKTIKNQCGVGGSCKDGEILIQGDLIDKIKIILEKLGYKTKGG